MSSDVAAPASSAVVPQEDFDALWDEFKDFKALSANVENALNAQMEEQENEIKRLRRALAEEQSQKEDARGRLSGQQSSDLALYERVNDLQQQVEVLKAKNRVLEDKCEALEHDNHKDAFQQRRLEDTCNAAEERAILAESRVEELEEACAKLRGDVQKLRDLTDSVDSTPPPLPIQRSQSQVVAQAARDDAIRDMKVVAARLRSIASKCGAAIGNGVHELS